MYTIVFLSTKFYICVSQRVSDILEFSRMNLEIKYSKNFSPGLLCRLVYIDFFFPSTATGLSALGLGMRESGLVWLHMQLGDAKALDKVATCI